MTLLVDTRTVPPHERFDYWAESSCRLFHPLELRQNLDRPFWGTVSGHGLGQLEMFRLVADSSRAARTHRGISTSDPECLLVAIQARGRCEVTQEGRTTTLNHREVASYESSHPYTVHATGPFELVVFAIPRSVLGPSGDRLYSQTAQRIAVADGLARLAVPFLLQIADGLDAGTLYADDFDLGESVLDLVRGLYADRHASRGVERGPTRVERILRIKSFVEANLGDSRLDALRIADANAISVRYLYKLFEPEAVSLREWIRNQRLERCRRDLADPSLAGETIFRIASRWGWTSAAHFSRLFHSTYGCSPRQYRLRAHRMLSDR